MCIQASLVLTDHFIVKKASNTKQDTYQLPFYCDFNFTCLVSAHEQTLNEYPDTNTSVVPILVNIILVTNI